MSCPSRIGAAALAVALLAAVRGASAGPPAEPLPVVDQDGNRLELERDLIEGRVVVLNAFFTSCTSICPVVARTLTGLQARLGDRLGRDVHMVSITLDPAVDGPARLKEYATRLEARPGWRFVTGEPAAVERALRRLGFSVARPQEHSGMLLVVNQPKGLWRKASGLASVEDVERVLDAVMRAPAVPK